MLTINKEEILKGLAQSTGTQNYYRHFLGLKYTDGVKYLAETCQSYWLIDVIASYQSGYIRLITPQVWTLKKAKKGSSCKVLGLGPEDFKIASQRISYTDFPLDEIKLYLCEGVLMLPSEY